MTSSIPQSITINDVFSARSTVMCTLRRVIYFSVMLSLILSFLVYYQFTKLTKTSTFLPRESDTSLPFVAQPHPSVLRDGSHPLDEADFIVRNSYLETYARMATCSESETERKCIQVVVDKFQQQREHHEWHSQNTSSYSVHSTNSTSSLDSHATSNIEPLPWWFQTLLRDIPTNGAYGFWHHFSTSSTIPPIKFCAIGKNGSTEWRRVFKALNAWEVGGGDKGGFQTRKEVSNDPRVTPHVVFLRDPLERLLSAYLDKCVKDNVRKFQGHCEPNIIFGRDHLNQKRKRGLSDESTNADISLPIFMDIAQNFKKEMFAAYVDLFPLKWNVHFVPQAIFCDLYRNIDNYDKYFMGAQFMSELHRMATQYKGSLPLILNDTFQYQTHSNSVQNDSRKNIGTEKAHGTQAPAKVKQYYSAKAIRKALEYLSIDYVTLGLQIPDWAREMLRVDNASKHLT